jgi:hypothetical protein
MHAQLRAVALRQRGLVTREQCRRAGLRDPEIRDRTATHGPWVVVRRGVYIERELWQQADRDQKLSLGDLAAHLCMHVPHLLSHDSAAREQGIPLLRPPRELTHVTRKGVQGSRTAYGIKHHLTRIDLHVTTGSEVMPTTSPARTGLDLAREHGFITGVGALDHVLRTGVPRAELDRELEVMWSWPGVRQARRALGFADPRAETLAESLGRCLLEEAGFLDIDLQWPVLAGGTVCWVDLRVGCHLIEVDGLHKYLPADQGGLAQQPTRAVLRDERRRQAAICGEGLGMSRLIWDDMFGRARGEAIARLRAEEAVTRARFGNVLPSRLAEQAQRLRAAYRRRNDPRAM